MTLPDHVKRAARQAFVEHSGYEMVETDFEASGIGPSIDAAIQAGLASLWQDIESAPKDEEIIGFYFDHGNPHMLIVWFESKTGEWCGAGYSGALPMPRPTHWAPLLPIPQPGEEG